MLDVEVEVGAHLEEEVADVEGHRGVEAAEGDSVVGGRLEAEELLVADSLVAEEEVAEEALAGVEEDKHAFLTWSG